MKPSRWIVLALLVGLAPVIAWSQDSASLQPPIFISTEYFFRRDTSNKVRPEYPLEAQEAGLKGTVLVFVVFDKDGKCLEVKPLISPHELLSDAVAKAVKQWRMTTKPYQYYPDAINWSEVRFVFSLDDGIAEVREAPEQEQRKESKETFLERMRRNKQIRERN